MKRVLLIIWVCLLALPSTSQAAPENKYVYGVGFLSCEKLTSALLLRPYDTAIKIDDEIWDSKSFAYIAWVQGFISAFNLFNDKGKNCILTIDQIAIRMKDYCSKNPSSLIISGAIEIITETTGYGEDKSRPFLPN